MKRISIALIGMSGCGKSTVGRWLAGITDSELIDTDRLIAERESMSITDIFETRGEDYFRAVEAEVVEEVSRLDNKIISTGGGVVLNPENIFLLRRNNRIVYLKRSPESIVASADLKGRPLLSGGADRVFEIFERRRGLYEKYCDFAVENEGWVSETVNKVLEALR